MKRTYLLFLLLTGFFCASAQQRLDKKGMSYLVAPKPNTIIYHDTVFSGSNQFTQLFYRTRDPLLIQLVGKHQSNKIAGQVLGLTGTIATLIGISKLSGTDNKGLGWALLGGGFGLTLTGGYLTVMGQRNLQMAVTLFNQRQNQSSVGIGVSGQKAGLVYQF